MSALTEYRVGDSQTILVAKMLRRLGGSPRPSDTEITLWRKVLIALGGVSRPEDNLFDTLLKILRIVDPNNFCICGDNIYDLLRKILEALAPGSFRTGDSIYDIIRKILANIVVTPGDNCCLLLESDGSELLLEVAPGCLQLESCAA